MYYFNIALFGNVEGLVLIGCPSIYRNAHKIHITHTITHPYQCNVAWKSTSSVWIQHTKVLGIVPKNTTTERFVCNIRAQSIIILCGNGEVFSIPYSPSISHVL